MNQPRVRVGIVGAGAVTAGSHLPVLVNLPAVSVEWICDRSGSTAAAVARSYGVAASYSDVAQCPDVDVVLVATPVGSRRELVPSVLARGWHAFCEKPFALTLAEHDAYIAAARRHGVEIAVGQMRRYATPTATARSLLQRGFLGPVLRVAAAEGARVRATGRGVGWHMTDPSEGGGVLMETGSHLVDQMLYVLDVRDASLREASQRRHLGLELASSLVADIVTARGENVECRIDLSMLDDLCNGVFVEFPNYVLKIGLFFEDGLSLITREGETLCEIVPTEGVDNATTAFAAEWVDFLEQCRTGKPSAIDAASVRHTTALIEAAYARTQDSELVASGAAGGGGAE
ncbi:MAG: Gfo/Idh/MocA family protein [Gemmatimonadaceae bacterium]